LAEGLATPTHMAIQAKKGILMTNIYQKLREVQLAIKVTKDRHNEFGGFDYRSASDILAEVKPLCAEHGVVLVLTDRLHYVGEQYYIEAIATIYDTGEPQNEIVASAFAREERERPKMAEPQLTGSASSYARKYALNGLLLLDDAKDPDSQDNSTLATKAAPKPLEGPASDKQKSLINQKLQQQGVANEEQAGYITERFGVEIPLTKEGASFVIEELIGGNQ
jgi:hypothetical protein